MPNYLKMPKKSQVLALLELGWSYRRIEAETGVRRETVSRYDRMRRANAAKTFPGSDPSPPAESPDLPDVEGSNAAKTFAGSDANPAKTFPGSAPRPRFTAAVYRTAIAEKLDAGLSLQRIWQDLVEEYGYGASYESVKRFVRTIAPTRRAVGVFHCAPGAEGQVDFFRGAPTLDVGTGEWRRPWVFRMTLGHSRHGYEEAVWDQKLETFLRLHERAFRDLGGVPLVIRHDNLKAAVVRACFFDPDSHEVYLAFAQHWGFTPLPTQPRTPQENGKQERSGGYVKDNALKGRSLTASTRRMRFCGTGIAPSRACAFTARRAARSGRTSSRSSSRRCSPSPAPRFRSSPPASGPSTPTGTSKWVAPSIPCRSSSSASASACSGIRTSCASSTWTRSWWCTRASPAGVFAPRAGEAEASTRQQAFVDRLVGQCERVGPAVKQWADAALAARGVRAIRLIQGVLGLTRRHPRERILAAVTEAHAHQHFRYHTIRRLVERTPAPPRPTLVTDDPAIRPMTQYTLEDFLR